jgi:hypothetical protein
MLGFVKPPRVHARHLQKVSKNEQTVFFCAVFGVLILAGFVLDRFRDYLFPKKWFCIGRQQRAYENRKAIANLVFVVILLGFIINMAATILAPK